MREKKTKDLLGLFLKIAQIRKLEAKMLDIISMAILLFTLVGLPVLLILIKGGRSEEEEILENEEQMKYLEEYKKKKEDKKARRKCKWKKNHILGNK